MYLAHRHGAQDSPNLLMEEPAFLDELGDVTGSSVLDLGCGDAAFGEQFFAAGGVRYVGVDSSAGMLAAARRRLAGTAAEFVESRIEDHAAERAAFDLVVSRMALHYVDDLDAALRAMCDALRPAGRVIFSVVHPVISSNDDRTGAQRTTWTVDEYFERGAREHRWFGSPVMWRHRTVEDYVTATRRAGFDLVGLRECEPDAGALASRPDELRRRRRVPLMLLLHGRLSHDVPNLDM